MAAYARQSADWTFTVSPASFSGFPETFTMSVESLAGWSGDGAMSVITSRAEAVFAARLGIPVINLSGTLPESPIPRVMVDHRAIGVLAAEHLIERGLRNFAYYGVKGPWYARLRREVFGVERLVKGVSISRRRLEKGFRESVGQTPHEFICQTRVNRAKDLLSARGRVLVHDVAVACGFPDPRRFRLVFRRITGMSPTAYRKKSANSRERSRGE